MTATAESYKTGPMNERLRVPTVLRILLAVVLPIVLITAGCSSDDSNETGGSNTENSTDGGGAGTAVRIGAQDFNESTVLAHVYGEALSRAGYDVTYKDLGGYRDILYAAFAKGDVNFTLDYASSALEFLNEQAGEASPDIDVVMPLLNDQLGGKNLKALEPSPAVDSNAFVVTKETAEARNLSSLADLTDDLRLGGFADCPTNPFCIPGLKDRYGVDLAGKFSAQDGGDLTKTALKGGEIDVAVLTTTDPDIAANGWVVLSDDKGLINADNIVPVASNELLDTAGNSFIDLVNKISSALNTEALTELNRQFVIDKDDADQVAKRWLDDNGL